MAEKRVRVYRIVATTAVPSQSFIFTMDREQNFKSLASSPMLLNHTTRNKSLVTSLDYGYKKTFLADREFT